MAFVFKFPDVGEGIHEGTVVEWLVSEGERVAEDQPLLTVETDKAVVELPSPKAGVVLKIHFAAGDQINVGDDLVVIGRAGEAVVDRASAAAPEAPTSAAPATHAEAPEPAPKPAARPLATPRTRALAMTVTP